MNQTLDFDKNRVKVLGVMANDMDNNGFVDLIVTMMFDGKLVVQIFPSQDRSFQTGRIWVTD